MTFEGQPYYGNKIRFNPELPNQWYESGYFLHDDHIYPYEDDRKSNYYKVGEPMSINSFIEYAKENGIEIPEEFLKAIEG